MTDDDFRDLALAFDGVVEGAHMGHPDFRVNNRIFASLRHDGTTAMVKITPEQQAVLLHEHPKAFVPSPGAWRGLADASREAATLTCRVPPCVHALTGRRVATGVRSSRYPRQLASRQPVPRHAARPDAI